MRRYSAASAMTSSGVRMICSIGLTSTTPRIENSRLSTKVAAMVVSIASCSMRILRAPK